MIPLSVPEISGNEWNYIKECLDDNWVSSAGKYVDLFEEKFKAYVGSKRAVVTVNGTAALHLALVLAGVGPGDEVIVPSMTFIASVNPIIYLGARPVFVDVCRNTFVIDVNRIENLITEKTKVIMPVHLYGNMVDMEPVMHLADKYGICVVEDATEALGSEYKDSKGLWHKAGTIGHMGCFSFNGNKLITTGAGGMLVTNNTELGDKAKFLSTQAKEISSSKAFFHPEVGYNYRMPNLLAAMGVAQLEKIEEYLEKKKRITAVYQSYLDGIPGLTMASWKQNVSNFSWLNSFVIESGFGMMRDELIRYLLDDGIETRPFFQPIHKMEPYKEYRHDEMSITIELSNKGINLPSSVGIKEKEIVQVCQAIIRASSKAEEYKDR